MSDDHGGIDEAAARPRGVGRPRNTGQRYRSLKGKHIIDGRTMPRSDLGSLSYASQPVGRDREVDEARTFGASSGTCG